MQVKLFQTQRKCARRIQHHLRGLRTRRAYQTVREETKKLQRAALVKLAHMKAAELKEDPSSYKEILQRDEGALDSLINATTGETLSLTQSVALSQLFREHEAIMRTPQDYKEVHTTCPEPDQPCTSSERAENPNESWTSPDQPRWSCR